MADGPLTTFYLLLYTNPMSGHNKWSKVKHIKAKEDAKKGKAFSKASKEIAQAAREGGGDPEMNPALAAAIERAKEVNMPKENIQAAVDRATGEGLEGGLQTVILEGYGPGGVAFIIKAETDNRNRTTSEVRKIFTQYKGSLGEAGSTSYIFESGEPSFKLPVEEDTAEKIKEMVGELEQIAEVEDVLTNLG